MKSNFKIEYINENDYNRIFVVSDIHGYYNLFEKLLNKIDLTKNDLLIILGDSCDRGENSIELYLKYIELQEQGYQVKHIWGNHEEMLYESAFVSSYYRDLWYRVGGDETAYNYTQYIKKIIGKNNKKLLDISNAEWLKKFLEEMPFMIISDKSIFVHAGFDCSKSVEEQEVDYLLWNRDKFWENNNTGKSIYFGHTPSISGEVREYINNVFCLDTGSFFNYRLGVMEIKSKEMFYIE